MSAVLGDSTGLLTAGLRPGGEAPAQDHPCELFSHWAAGHFVGLPG